MDRLHWLDVLLLPLTWVARARGRWRLLLLTGYGLILGTIGVLVGREAVLWKIPDAPEPFDLARYGHVDLPDADNAMALYRQAVAAIAPGTPRNGGMQGVLTPGMVEPNRPALDLWLRGAERPDALLDQPGTLASPGRWEFLEALDMLGRLADFDSTRRRAAGDLAGAWALDRATIRSGLHIGRHARSVSVSQGLMLVQGGCGQATAWADDPGMTPELLRRALADLAACRPLETSDGAEARVDYLGARADLLDPDARLAPRHSRGGDPAWEDYVSGAFRSRDFLWNEPKRSLKVLRLVAAGRLAQADRPIAARPAWFDVGHQVYQVDASTPPVLARIRPADLAAWVAASHARGPIGMISVFGGSARTVRANLDRLRVHLAERAYKLEHSGRPATTFGDLLGPYLDAPPEGLTAGDGLKALEGLRVR